MTTYRGLRGEGEDSRSFWTASRLMPWVCIHWLKASAAISRIGLSVTALATLSICMMSCGMSTLSATILTSSAGLFLPMLSKDYRDEYRVAKDWCLG